MGEIADSLINGEFDMYTGEYIGEPCGYPRTMSNSEHTLSKKKRKKIGEIKREISAKIKELTDTGMKESQAINEARREANLKYGKQWRNGVIN